MRRCSALFCRIEQIFINMMYLSPDPSNEICWPDVRIKDGDIIELGNTTIRAVLAPGHTLGTMAFFFDVTDDTKVYRVGYFGGVGFITIYKEFCRKYRLPENKCERLKNMIEKLLCEEVDIVIGNHPNQNCTVEKREYMKKHPNHNPFINKESWKLFLKRLEESRQDFEVKGY